MNAIAYVVREIAAREVLRRMRSELASQRAFFGISALLFVTSAAATILWCTSMSSMGAMDMPGGWTMSMAWMRMPGQTWAAATASFLGMWIIMMVAMMLPSLVPMLRQYRRVVRATEVRLGLLTLLVGTGYFFVWSLLGLAVFPLGVATANALMRQSMLARAVPVVVGVIVLGAGALQLTAWKARQLGCCREEARCTCVLPARVDAAWKYGMQLGLRCCSCCAGMTAVLLVIGVMDLRAMALVTAATTAERLLAAGERVARALGIVLVGTGLILIARAGGFA